jgi:hypothetical protein
LKDKENGFELQCGALATIENVEPLF